MDISLNGSCLMQTKRLWSYGGTNLAGEVLWALNRLIKLKTKNTIGNSAIYMRINYLCCCTASINEMRWAKPWSLQRWLISETDHLNSFVFKILSFVCDWPVGNLEVNSIVEQIDSNGKKHVCLPFNKGYVSACCQNLSKTGCYDNVHCSDNLRWEKLRDSIVL